MNKELEMNPNQLVAFIGKPCAEFTISKRTVSVWLILCIRQETDV